MSNDEEFYYFIIGHFSVSLFFIYLLLAKPTFHRQH